MIGFALNPILSYGELAAETFRKHATNYERGALFVGVSRPRRWVIIGSRG